MQYLSADGGGTKLIVIRYDENMNLLGVGKAAGTNLNFRSLEDITADMEKAVAEALGEEKHEIEAADFVIVGPGDVFERVIREQTKLGQANRLAEGQAALMAGTGEKYGLLALAGTGSDAFYYTPDCTDGIGGWGTVLGDEGGGFDVGTKTLRAAIYAEDGRGEKTEILPLLMEEWKMTALWDMVEKVYHTRDQRRLVASVAKVTSKAAHMGDPVALSIYRDAAWEIARLTNTMLARHDGYVAGKICISGGVWKGHPSMLEHFKKLVHKEYPHVEIVSPVFDPCMGGIVYRALEMGQKKEDFFPVLLEKFGQFRYE